MFSSSDKILLRPHLYHVAKYGPRISPRWQFKMDRMYTLNRTIGDLTRVLKTYKAKQRGSELMSIKLGASDTPRKQIRVVGQNWGSTNMPLFSRANERVVRRYIVSLEFVR